MSSGELLEGYVVDIIGSIIVEKAMDTVQLELKSMKNQITNRYSPGYCEWNVEEQKKLFSLLPDNFCNISLNDSALMLPIKSVSGFIGIGKDVRYHEYSCEKCNRTNCIYANKKVKNV